MTKWCFRMEKASKDWLRNKILWLSDQNSRKKSHVTEYPYIGDHFRKWFDYSSFYDFKHVHIRFLAIFGIWSSWQELGKFSRKVKNQWFLALHFNIIVRSQNVWYEYTFFMSIRYNFEFMKFVSYNMEGRMGGAMIYIDVYRVWIQFQILSW